MNLKNCVLFSMVTTLCCAGSAWAASAIEREWTSREIVIEKVINTDHQDFDGVYIPGLFYQCKSQIYLSLPNKTNLLVQEGQGFRISKKCLLVSPKYEEIQQQQEQEKRKVADQIAAKLVGGVLATAVANIGKSVQEEVEVDFKKAGRTYSVGDVIARKGSIARRPCLEFWRYEQQKNGTLDFKRFTDWQIGEDGTLLEEYDAEGAFLLEPRPLASVKLGPKALAWENQRRRGAAETEQREKLASEQAEKELVELRKEMAKDNERWRKERDLWLSGLAERALQKELKRLCFPSIAKRLLLSQPNPKPVEK